MEKDERSFIYVVYKVSHNSPVNWDQPMWCTDRRKEAERWAKRNKPTADWLFYEVRRIPLGVPK